MKKRKLKYDLNGKKIMRDNNNIVDVKNIYYEYKKWMKRKKRSVGKKVVVKLVKGNNKKKEMNVRRSMVEEMKSVNWRMYKKI
jgi:hypothetical protein